MMTKQQKVEKYYALLNEMLEESRNFGYRKAIGTYESTMEEADLIKLELVRIEMRKSQEEEMKRIHALREELKINFLLGVNMVQLVTMIALCIAMIIVFQIPMFLLIIAFFIVVLYVTNRAHFMGVVSEMTDHAHKFGYYQGIEYLVDYRHLSATEYEDSSQIKVF